MVQPCDTSTQEVEAGESEVQSQPWLHSELEVRLGYIRPCHNFKNNKDNLQVATLSSRLSCLRGPGTWGRMKVGRWD